LKAYLKQSDLLVNVSRFTRQLTSVWHKVLDERRQEKSRLEVVQQRKAVIEHYLINHAIHKLQIGTGENLLPGWLNTDLEPMAAEVIHLDALEPFPFKDNEFDYIFSEHMIEHIPYIGGLFMLKECFRVIKPGGKIRIATPDIEKIVGLFSATQTEEQKKYIEWSATQSIGLYRPEKTKLQQRRAEWDIDYTHIMRQYPDSSRDPACFIVNNFFRSYGHQFLYNELTLAGILHEAGFTDVCRYNPSESDDAELQNLETHGRLIGEEINNFETMILQAARPSAIENSRISH
jgi:SAM-dependent methyltransferase